MAGQHGAKKVLRGLLHLFASFRREVVLQFALEISAGRLLRGWLNRGLVRDFRFNRKPLLTPPRNLVSVPFSGIYRHFDPPNIVIQFF